MKAFLLLLAILPALSQAADCGAVRPLDEPLPDLSWHDGEGRLTSLDLDGRPAILHFWAAWCIPCVKELPDLARWKEKHPDIALIPLSMDKKRVQANSMMQRSGADLPVWLIENKSLGNFKIRGLPLTLVVNPQGRILHRIEGPAPWEQVEFARKIRCLVQSPGE